MERDIDLFQQLPSAEIGMTITTTDDALGRFLEVHATSVSRRLRSLAKLNAAGLTTYAFVGPLLPHFAYQEDLLDDLFHELASCGTRQIYVKHMNLSSLIMLRLREIWRTQPDEIQEIYQQKQQTRHKAALDELVSDLAQKHKLTLRLGKAIVHAEAKDLKRLNRR